MTTDDALNFILEGRNCLITGAGGSGKSTLIHSLSNFFDGVMIKVAPTALAALNVNGSTAHRVFGLDFGVFVEGLTLKKNLKNSKSNLDTKMILYQYFSDIILASKMIFLKKNF